MMRGDIGDAVRYVRERLDDRLRFHYENDTPASYDFREELAYAVDNPLGSGANFGHRTEAYTNLLQRIEGLSMVDGRVGHETIGKVLDPQPGMARENVPEHLDDDTDVEPTDSVEAEQGLNLDVSKAEKSSNQEFDSSKSG